MFTPYGEMALTDALNYGMAILKYISPNDVGATGSHMRGYYLPKPVWQHFTVNPPEKGINAEESVKILWQDGRITDSKIHWYGSKTRSEYRLTCFQRDFPWLTADNVGDLLILIPTAQHEFRGYVLYEADDIDEIQTKLGVDIISTWVFFQKDVEREKDPLECVDRQFRAFVEPLTDFPTTDSFSVKTLEALRNCINHFDQLPADTRLIEGLEHEFRLFRMAERLLYRNHINRIFESIDDFLETAQSILQRRKSRAGRSFEYHVAEILRSADIPFSAQPSVDGIPDFIIPSKDAYEDRSYSPDRICILALKRTCKDRWRQVTQEAKRVPIKHLMTIQGGISLKQMNEMDQAQVKLIVPSSLHQQYPKEGRGKLMTVDQFLTSLKRML